jgi:WD40 repeat protein
MLTLALALAIVTEPPKPTLLNGHQGTITTLAWAADGKSLASAGSDRTLRLWDPATGKETSMQAAIARSGYGSPVVAFTADLQTMAVNYWGEITIRSVTTGKILVRIDPILDRGQRSAFRPDVFALAFSPDGKRLASAGSTAAVGGSHGLPGGRVCVWDVETGKLVHQSDKLSTAASSVAWSNDGNRYAAGTNGAGGELPQAGEVLVWEVASGKSLHSIKVRSEVEQGEWFSAGDVAFAPDGKSIAVPVTAGSRGAPAGLLIDDKGASILHWELASNKISVPATGLKAAVHRVVFSPDGQRLALAGADKIVRVWDVAKKQELVSLSCPDSVTAVAFSPDGNHLAAGSKNGVAQVWLLTSVKAER